MLNEPRTHEIKRLALQGLKPFEIRRITGAKYPLIYYVRRRLGLTKVTAQRPSIAFPDPVAIVKKKPGQWNPHIANIRQLKQQGASYAEIASIYGVTRQRIQQLIAVKAGTRCEECGKSNIQMHGHHENYLTDENKTLCVSCHRDKHSLESGFNF